MLDLEEIWRDILGYEGFYQGSNLGRVKSLDRIIEHPLKGPTKRRERILRPLKKKNGVYLKYRLFKNGIATTVSAHRVIFAAFHGYYPENVHHLDGNPMNNRLDNLEGLTRKEHVEETARLGQMPRGEDQYRSIVTEAQVREIREKYKSGGYSHRKLAREYGFKGHRGIGQIIRRQTWAHI